MPAAHLILLALAVIALALSSALFSAMETVLFSLPLFHLRKLQGRNPRLGASIDLLIERPRHTLALLLLADALVNVPLVILCVHLLREWRIPSLSGPWAKGLLIFALVVVVCDLLPKLLGRDRAHRLARPSLALLGAIRRLLDPVAELLGRAERRLSGAGAPPDRGASHGLSEGDLEILVEDAADQGAFHADESLMIRRILRLGDRTAKDLITPRVDLFALPDDLSNAEVIERAAPTRHRRIPIYDRNPDNIVGVLDLRRLLLDPATPYLLLIDPPSFVPETLNALALLRSFLKHRQRMAVVLDEFGGTEGIVTFGDLLEVLLEPLAPTEVER